MNKKFLVLLAISNLCLSSLFGNIYFHNIHDKNQSKNFEQIFAAFQESSYPKYLKELAPVAFIPAVFYKTQQLLAITAHELGHAAAITLQDEGIVNKLHVNWSGDGYCKYKPFYYLDDRFAREIPKQHLRKMLVRNISGPLAGATAAGLIGYTSLNYFLNSNNFTDNQRTALFAPLIATTMNIGWKQLYYNLFADEDLREKLYHTLGEKSDGTKALWDLHGMNPKYAENFWRLSQKINNSNFAIPSTTKQCILVGSLFSIATYCIVDDLDKAKKNRIVEQKRHEESIIYNRFYRNDYQLIDASYDWKNSTKVSDAE